MSEDISLSWTPDEASAYEEFRAAAKALKVAQEAAAIASERYRQALVALSNAAAPTQAPS